MAEGSPKGLAFVFLRNLGIIRRLKAEGQPAIHMKQPLQIPETTINRLALYFRQLERLENQGTATVQSHQLAEWMGLTASQVRKDLAYFGQFGVRGQGYDVHALKNSLSEILGISRLSKTIIVGAGNLGKALSSYRGFRKEGFDIVALFDNDSTKWRSQKGKPPVLPMTDLAKFARKEKAQIAILAVPAAAAQDALNLVAGAGIRSILNFAPVELTAPAGIHLRHVDLATELITLAYYSQA